METFTIPTIGLRENLDFQAASSTDRGRCDSDSWRQRMESVSQLFWSVDGGKEDAGYRAITNIHHQMIEVGWLLHHRQIESLRAYRVNGKPLSESTMPYVIYPGDNVESRPFKTMVVEGRGLPVIVRFIIESNWFSYREFCVWLASSVVIPEYMGLAVKKYLDTYTYNPAAEHTVIKKAVIRWVSRNVMNYPDQWREKYCRIIEMVIRTFKLKFGIGDVCDTTVHNIKTWLNDWCPHCRALIALEPKDCIRKHNRSDMSAAKDAVLTFSAVNSIERSALLDILRCYFKSMVSAYGRLSVLRRELMDMLKRYDHDLSDVFWENRLIFHMLDLNDISEVVGERYRSVWTDNLEIRDIELIGETYRLAMGFDRRGSVAATRKIDYCRIVGHLGRELAVNLVYKVPDLFNVSKVSASAMAKQPRLFLLSNPAKMEPRDVAKFFGRLKVKREAEACARHLLMAAETNPLIVINNTALQRIVMKHKKASPTCMAGIYLLRNFFNHYYADLLLLGMTKSPSSPLRLMDSNVLRIVLRNLATPN